MTFDRVLFPVDFSDRCAKTTQYVAQIACKFDSGIFLLHAVEPASLFSTGLEISTMTTSGYEATIDRLQESLNRFGEEEFEGLVVTRMLKCEEPARAITDYAAKNKIDLIIMPTHGRGAFRRFLLGSVTSKVLHDTNCAVLTTAHSEGLASGAEDPRNIICAVDLGDENLHIIANASDLAQCYGTTVRLVHAIPVPQPTPEFPIDPSLVQELLEEARERLDVLQGRCGVHWDICVQTGDVGEVVSRAAIGYQAGLVVIGRGKLNQPFGRLRTHVSSIIRQSPCPVMSIPENI
jgi:nucleotide-binding universal stress UspA family protein